MTGWLAVAAVVGVYDVHAAVSGSPTMSAAFRTASRKHPLAVSAACAYLIAHLYGALPRRIDPLRAFGGAR